MRIRRDVAALEGDRMPDATTTRDQFTLVISTDHLPAEELAALISSLDASFSAFVRGGPRGKRPRLAVIAVEHGSIQVILDAIDGVQKVLDAGKYLAPWATHLADVVKWYLFSIPPRLKPADRKVVRAISDIVVNDSATQVSLVNYGTVVFNVGPVEARNIKEALEAPLRNADMPRVASASLPQLLDRTQVDRLQSGDLLGTAFRVAGSWFARLEGGHGVLVPIHFHSTAGSELVDGQLHRFSGAPETGPRGETIGISLSGAHPLP